MASHCPSFSPAPGLTSWLLTKSTGCQARLKRRTFVLEAAHPIASTSYVLLPFAFAFFKFSAARNFTILPISLYGIGLSSGNCTEPLALS